MALLTAVSAFYPLHSALLLLRRPSPVRSRLTSPIPGCTALRQAPWHIASMFVDMYPRCQSASLTVQRRDGAVVDPEYSTARGPTARHVELTACRASRGPAPTAAGALDSGLVVARFVFHSKSPAYLSPLLFYSSLTSCSNTFAAVRIATMHNA